MSDKVTFDLDEALAALARDVRAEEPSASVRLNMAVLEDAASIASQRAGEVPKAMRPAARPRRLRLFDWFDNWAGASVATAAVIVMLVGLGVGYEAGPQLLSSIGLGTGDVAVADAGGGLFPSDDMI